MSWDVSLETKSGRYESCGNYTCNVAPMYKKAGLPNGSLNDLNGTPAKKMAEILAPVILYMKCYSRELTALEPSNGWGHYDGALVFLERIYNACRKYPRRVVVVS